MRFRASYLAVTALIFAAKANETIVGSTYDFTTSAFGTTTISPLGAQGSFTDPINPSFCVGPSFGPPTPTCNGLSGSIAFAQLSPTLDRITFHFSGITAGASPGGSFTIDLGNFVTTDGETITGITHSGFGTLFSGNFTNVTWDGTDALFTGTTVGGFTAFSGADIEFNVTTAPSAVPEPASLALLAVALLGLAPSGVAATARKVTCLARSPFL